MSRETFEQALARCVHAAIMEDEAAGGHPREDFDEDAYERERAAVLAHYDALQGQVIRISKNDRDAYPTRILTALSNGHISIGKACEALSHYFATGAMDAFHETGITIWEKYDALQAERDGIASERAEAIKLAEDAQERERRVVAKVCAERDNWKRIAEHNGCAHDKEVAKADRLRAALRAALMPVRESTLKGERWHEAYDAWWHQFASETAIDG